MLSSQRGSKLRFQGKRAVRLILVNKLQRMWFALVWREAAGAGGSSAAGVTL